MNWEIILWEGIKGSVSLAIAVAMIVVPLLLILELLKDSQLFERISIFFEPLVKLLTLPKEAALPLLVGIVFGILYGGSVIIQITREGKLNREDLLLLITFLAINHGLIEDTLLFMRIGAKGWILVCFRVVFSIIITLVLSRILKKDKTNQVQQEEK